MTNLLLGVLIMAMVGLVYQVRNLSLSLEALAMDHFDVAEAVDILLEHDGPDEDEADGGDDDDGLPLPTPKPVEKVDMSLEAMRARAATKKPPKL